MLWRSCFVCQDQVFGMSVAVWAIVGCYNYLVLTSMVWATVGGYICQVLMTFVHSYSQAFHKCIVYTHYRPRVYVTICSCQAYAVYACLCVCSRQDGWSKQHLMHADTKFRDVVGLCCWVAGCRVQLGLQCMPICRRMLLQPEGSGYAQACACGHGTSFLGVGSEPHLCYN